MTVGGEGRVAVRRKSVRLELVRGVPSVRAGHGCGDGPLLRVPGACASGDGVRTETVELARHWSHRFEERRPRPEPIKIIGGGVVSRVGGVALLVFVHPVAFVVACGFIYGVILPYGFVDLGQQRVKAMGHPICLDVANGLQVCKRIRVNFDEVGATVLVVVPFGVRVEELLDLGQVDKNSTTLEFVVDGLHSPYSISIRIVDGDLIPAFVLQWERAKVHLLPFVVTMVGHFEVWTRLVLLYGNRRFWCPSCNLFAAGKGEQVRRREGN